MRLEGKVALISGGARGMGAAEAKLFAQEGAKVAIGDILEDEGRKTEAEIIEAGGDCIFVHLDVTKESDWKDAVSAAVSRFGKLDILVNNAGVLLRGKLEETSSQDWDFVMGVNAKGTFLGTKAAIPEMRKAGGGSIINVASINAIRPIGGQVVYSITKAAVCSLTQGFAKELGPSGIRVNSLLPGITDTKFASALVQNEQFMEQVVPQIPLRRAAQPDEMSGMILYLASDASSYTTGASVVVDGGILA